LQQTQQQQLLSCKQHFAVEAPVCSISDGRVMRTHVKGRHQQTQQQQQLLSCKQHVAVGANTAFCKHQVAVVTAAAEARWTLDTCTYEVEAVLSTEHSSSCCCPASSYLLWKHQLAVVPAAAEVVELYTYT
jgi:hypothetical protein